MVNPPVTGANAGTQVRCAAAVVESGWVPGVCLCVFVRGLRRVGGLRALTKPNFFFVAGDVRPHCFSFKGRAGAARVHSAMRFKAELS